MKKKPAKENIEIEIISCSLGLSKTDSETFSAKERKLASEYNNLTSLLPKTLGTTKSPPGRVKKNLMKKIREKNYCRQFDFMFDKTEEWKQHIIKGIKYRQLAMNQKCGYSMILMKVEPGTFYPAHKHHGAEECYVIEGDLYAQGKILGPGDFHHAEAGTHHEPLYTKGGCTVMLVIDPADA